MAYLGEKERAKEWASRALTIEPDDAMNRSLPSTITSPRLIPTQHDLAVLGSVLVSGVHRPLKRDGALDGVDGAGEVHEDPIAHQLDDTAMVRGDDRLKDFLAAGLERGEGAGLVHLHETAVADHVGSQDRGEAALGAFFGHVA